MGKPMLRRLKALKKGREALKALKAFISFLIMKTAGLEARQPEMPQPYTAAPGIRYNYLNCFAARNSALISGHAFPKECRSPKSGNDIIAMQGAKVAVFVAPEMIECFSFDIVVPAWP